MTQPMYTVSWRARGASQVNYWHKPMTEAQATAFMAWCDKHYPTNDHEIVAWERVQRQAPEKESK